MKSLILISLFLFTSTAQAFVYIAGSVSSVRQIDTSDEGDANDGLLLEGIGHTVYLGFRFRLLAFEVFSKKFNAESKDGTLTFDLEDEMQGMGVRLYLFSFFNLKFGTMKHDASGDVKNNDSVLLEYESTSNGNYAGIGFTFPLKRWSVFVDFNQYASEHDTLADSGIFMHDYELGLRYLF